ncbi:MAG: hypothetical protein ABIQ04_01650 [Candidatus Saccharimonadales bacterium]
MTQKKLSQKEMDEITNRSHEEAERDFKDFKEHIARGECGICDEPLSSFDEMEPCMHWLLMPPGFRKKHMKSVFEIFTYDRIEAYLRWYANSHSPLMNINDLVEEHDGTKLRALTIKHGQLEWSFSFAQGCLEGKDGNHGPHYHFQMRIDGKPFHNYSDRHIKMNDYELWMFDIDIGQNPQFKRNQGFGAGMQSTVDNIETGELLKTFKYTEDYENAAFNTSTIVMAEEGKTIDVDEIIAMYKIARETGTPVHQQIKNLKNVATTKVIVEPGEGVPHPAQRNPVRPGRKKNKDKKH